MRVHEKTVTPEGNRTHRDRSCRGVVPHNHIGVHPCFLQLTAAPAYDPAGIVSIVERLSRGYDPHVCGRIAGAGFEPAYRGYEPRKEPLLNPTVFILLLKTKLIVYFGVTFCDHKVTHYVTY